MQTQATTMPSVRCPYRCTAAGWPATFALRRARESAPRSAAAESDDRVEGSPVGRRGIEPRGIVGRLRLHSSVPP